MENLMLYRINTPYVEYLQQFENKVKNNEKNGNKRAYIGIVDISGVNYLIPLGSPKPKHVTLSENIDFMKIFDNGKLKSVININNMIPVPNEELNLIDIDNENLSQKYILYLEQRYLRKNERADEIIDNANKIHAKILKSQKYKTQTNSLVLRCCNFPLLEQKMREYAAKPELLLV